MNKTFTLGSAVMVLCMMLSNFSTAVNPPLGETHANIWVSLEHFRSQEPASYMALRIENEDGSLFAELGAHNLSHPISVPKGQSYYVTPISYTGHKSRLVDVYSIALFQEHIIGYKALPNFCEILIADWTLDGRLTAQDKTAMIRKIINKDQSAQMKINFAIKSDDNCPEPRLMSFEGQSITQLVEVIEDDVYLEYVYNIDGDLGRLATIESLIPVNTTPLPNNDPAEVYVATPDIFVEANQEYTILFELKSDAELIGFQFTPMLAGVTPEPGATLIDHIMGSMIYTFTSPVSGQLSDLLTLSNEYVDLVAYDVLGNRLKLGLEWESSSITKDAQLNAQLWTTPNPFIENTQIQLDITNPGTYQIYIYDVAGKQLYYQNVQLTEGQHQILVPATTFDGAGMYFVKLSNGQAQQVTKIVKQ